MIHNIKTPISKRIIWGPKLDVLQASPFIDLKTNQILSIGTTGFTLDEVASDVIKPTLIISLKYFVFVFVIINDSNPTNVTILDSFKDWNDEVSYINRYFFIRVKFDIDEAVLKNNLLDAFNNTYYDIPNEKTFADYFGEYALDNGDSINLKSSNNDTSYFTYNWINVVSPINSNANYQTFIEHFLSIKAFKKLRFFNLYKYNYILTDCEIGKIYLKNFDLTNLAGCTLKFHLDIDGVFDDVIQINLSLKKDIFTLFTQQEEMTPNIGGSVEFTFDLPFFYDTNKPLDKDWQFNIEVTSDEGYLYDGNNSFDILSFFIEVLEDSSKMLLYSRNPIKIEFKSDEVSIDDEIPENLTLNASLFCEKEYATSDDLGNENFTKVLDQYAYPKINNIEIGIGSMNIEKLLNTFMEKQYQDNLFEALPYSNNNNIAHHLLKRFYYKYYESFGSPVVNGVISNSSIYTVMLGGVGFLDFANGNKGLAEPLLLTVDTRIVSQNVIKYNQYIGKGQPCFLYFIKPKNNGFDNDFTVNIKFYYTDMTSQVVDDILLFTDSNTLSDFGAYFIKCGYNDIVQFSNPMKSIYRWDITIKCPKDETSFDLTKSFYLACDSLYTLNLMYRNSLGGYDTISLEAPKEYNFTTQKIENERFLNDNYQLHDAQFIQETAKARESIKVNTGNRMLTIFQKEMKELLTSKYVFILPKNTSDVFIPININAGNFKIADESDFVYDVKLELQVANNYINKDDLELWYK